MDRRELFSFLSSPIKEKEDEKQKILRPSYYDDVTVFGTECPKCVTKDCASLCQEQIILIDEEGLPYLNFSQSGCTYCDECALACKSDVLKVENKKLIDAKITISKNDCLSWNATMCFSCKDPCLDDAIEFKAMFMPQIIEEKCTSCGFCLSRCPTNAIKVEVI